jgi:EAL domain-containing protein (putative c-di-GMP-specific phosphodiesterase class I)
MTDAGLMGKMTQLVLEMALDQAATWREQGLHLSVAVNLSAASLIDPGLPRLIGELLASKSVPPSALQVEITEESLLGDRIRVRSVLTTLRATGVRVAVDDFGTGYSSLAYLRDLPLDELKLDRSFIAPMADDARAAALVASTIALAHSLGLRMVAEGVEHEIAYTELARNGCDEAQGHYMCRPVPAAELEHWLALRRTRSPSDHL